MPKPTTVRFTVTVPEETHRDLRLLAAARNKSLNELVHEGLQLLLNRGQSDVSNFINAWRRGREGLGLWELDQPTSELQASDSKPSKKGKQK